MAEATFELVIFKKKTFGSLLEEIHSNVQNSIKENKTQIDSISELIEDVGSAIQLTDKIQAYIKLNNESNDHLIKLAGIVQKCFEKDKKSTSPDDGYISEEERKELEDMALQYKLAPSIKMIDTAK